MRVVDVKEASLKHFLRSTCTMSLVCARCDAVYDMFALECYLYKPTQLQVVLVWRGVAQPS